MCRNVYRQHSWIHPLGCGSLVPCLGTLHLYVYIHIHILSSHISVFHATGCFMWALVPKSSGIYICLIVCIYMALPSGATENKFGNIETGEERRVICIFCPLFVFRRAYSPARPRGITRKCLCHGDSPKQRRLSMRKQRKEAKSDSPKTKNTNNLKFNRNRRIWMITKIVLMKCFSIK